MHQYLTFSSAIYMLEEKKKCDFFFFLKFGEKPEKDYELPYL
jgi:hypothetical protein